MRKRWSALLAMSSSLLVCVALLAGCGSSTSPSSESAAEPAATSEAGASANSEGGRKLNTAVIEERLQPYLNPPHKLIITEPLKKRPTGKRVEFLECSATPCKILGAAFKKASTTMGMQYKAVQAGATPETFQAAAEQAIADKPAAVLMASIDQSLIKKQLAEMKADGIVTYDQATLNPPGATTVAFLDPTYYNNVGAAAARYMMLHSGGHAHVLYVNQSLFSFGGAQAEGMKKTIQSECPGCTFTEVDTKPEEVGTEIPSLVVSELQSHPSINWAYFSYGEMDLGVPQAMEAAGIEGVQLMSQAGAENNYQNLKSGKEKACLDVNNEELAWYVIDSVARAVEGEHPANHVESANFSYLIEGKNITFDPNTEVFEADPNYKEEFAKLWGVK